MPPEDDPPVPQIWRLMEKGSQETDPQAKRDFQEVYSDAADLYHEYRPRYGGALIDKAIESSILLKENKNATILELGCGPGTLTLSLAQRGFQITSIDPGSGMIAKAREVCKEYDNVSFQQKSFKEFSSNGPFDAIVAATSLHWALAEDEESNLIQKLHDLVRPGGTLVVFYNFPPEPKDLLLDKVADALGKPKPFYFAGGTLAQHRTNVQERFLGPIEESPFFSKFDTSVEPYEEIHSVPSYIQFLKTLSNHILMEPKEKDAFFATFSETFQRESGDTIPNRRESILSIATRIKQ